MIESQQDAFVRTYVLVRAGKLQDALDTLVDPADGRLRKAFRGDANHAWYCVADILFKQARFREAVLAFKRSLRSRPDDVDALMAVGNCYDTLGRPRYAERYFRRALYIADQRRRKGLRHSIVFNLANALFDQGRLTEAMTLYAALSRAPAAIKAAAANNVRLTKERLRNE